MGRKFSDEGNDEVRAPAVRARDLPSNRPSSPTPSNPNRSIHPERFVLSSTTLALGPGDLLFLVGEESISEPLWFQVSGDNLEDFDAKVARGRFAIIQADTKEKGCLAASEKRSKTLFGRGGYLGNGPADWEVDGKSVDDVHQGMSDLRDERRSDRSLLQNKKRRRESEPNGRRIAEGNENRHQRTRVRSKNKENDDRSLAYLR